MNFDDPSTEFPNKSKEFILTKLKGFLILGLEKILKLVPKDYIIDTPEKCDCEELRIQCKAFDNAILKWQKRMWQNGRKKDRGSFVENPNIVNTSESRTYKSLYILKTVYLTIISLEANYIILSSYIIDEYNKLKE